jgi:hypothetical protein
MVPFAYKLDAPMPKTRVLNSFLEDFNKEAKGVYHK